MSPQTTNSLGYLNRKHSFLSRLGSVKNNSELVGSVSVLFEHLQSALSVLQMLGMFESVEQFHKQLALEHVYYP